MRQADPALLRDFQSFAVQHVHSMDIDPAYPVLRHLLGRRYASPDDRLKASLWYVAWYDLGSAMQAWDYLHDLEGLFSQPRLRRGTERRGLGNDLDMARHLESLDDYADLFGSWQAFLEHPTWDETSWYVGLAWGNGRWGQFKTCEILAKVHGYPIHAPDMANTGGSGHVAGLMDLYGAPLGADAQDYAAHDLQGRVFVDGYNLPWESLETVLCDFHSMLEGRYYVGHDIDQMLEQADRAPDAIRTAILDARAATLPHEYLGEMHGWGGVDRDLCRGYAPGLVPTR